MKALVLSTILLLGNLALAQTADEIIEKAENKMQGTTVIAEMTVTTIRPKWRREMEIKTWSDGSDLSVTLILSPAKDKGSVYLKRYNEMWNYVPSIERTVKMPPSMMSQSWMGTDLTNDDLVKETSLKDDFNKEIVGNEEIEGFDCYKIEMTPKEGVNAIWGKILIWISKEDYLQLKTEFYDEDGELVNTMLGKEVKEMGGKVIPTVFVVIPANKKGERTVMRYKSIEFGSEIPEEYFTTQYMKRLK